MKDKLKKDLVILRKLWVRIVLSIMGGICISAYYNSDVAVLYGVAIVFIVLYLLIAWLYGNEGNENTKQ